jgi:hypothetical protein
VTRAALLLLAVVACKGSSDAPAPHEGHQLAPPEAPAPPAPRPALECAPEAGDELIYLISHDDELWRFDPRLLDTDEDPLHRIGVLGCNIQSHPFAMAIDRHGMALVDYQDGSTYFASILDAHCTYARHAPGMPKTFSATYVRSGDHDVLFATPEHDAEIGTIAEAEPLVYSPVLPLRLPHERSPELQGTADGKLFGYFPEHDGGFVQEIDILSGLGTGARMPISDKPVGEIGAWTFAQYAGTFYVFVAKPNGAHSWMYAVRRKDGANRFVRSIPFRAVGAGVSTCAPELEKAN